MSGDFTPLGSPTPPDPRIERRRLDMIADGTFKGGPPTDDGALIGARENKEERS